MFIVTFGLVIAGCSSEGVGVSSQESLTFYECDESGVFDQNFCEVELEYYKGLYEYELGINDRLMESNRLYKEGYLRYERKVELAYRCVDYVFPRCPSSSREIPKIYCTGSMRPTLSCYDVVKVFSPTSPSQVNVCDVIVFGVEPHLNGDVVVEKVMHRVVGVNETNGTLHYITKGDAHSFTDGYSPTFEDVGGVVCREQK